MSSGYRAFDPTPLVIFCSGSVGFTVGLLSHIMTNNAHSNYVIPSLVGLTIASFVARVGYSTSKNVETVPVLEGFFGGMFSGYYLGSFYWQQ